MKHRAPSGWDGTAVWAAYGAVILMLAVVAAFYLSGLGDL